MKQIQANNLKPGDILINIGTIDTVKLTKKYVEISIVGAPTSDSKRYWTAKWANDESVYIFHIKEKVDDNKDEDNK